MKNNTKIEIIDVKEITPNPNNPRIIKDDKFIQLVKSIKDFPEMLNLRPIIIDENNIILGGNMRFKAILSSGLKKVPVIKIESLSEDQKKEFIIKDNIGFGEWDYDILANEWNNSLLIEWGLDVWESTDNIDLNDFFTEDKEEKKDNNFTIILEFNENEFLEFNESLKKFSGSKEKIIIDLLKK